MSWKDEIRRKGYCPTCGADAKAKSIMNVYKLECCGTYYCSVCLAPPNVRRKPECEACGNPRRLDLVKL